MKVSILVGLSFLLTLLPYEAQLATSSGCDASCLDGTPSGQWPPEGFSEDEVAVRCAVRCSQEMVEEEGCVRGCLVARPLTSVDQCNTTCLDFEEPSSCSRGCDIYDEIELVPASEENNTQGGVSLIPLQVTTAEGQPYHYNISVPGYNSSAAYYLVLLDLGTNQTAFRKIDEQTEEVDLSGLSICSEVELSYAVLDMDLDTPPLVSPGVDITVSPEPPTNIATSFEEDFDFLQHAILNVTWELPEGVSYCSLQLSLEVTSSENEDEKCASQNSYTTTLNNNETSHTISAPPDDVNNPPLYDCSYNLTIQVFPGGKIASQEVRVKYSGQRATILPECRTEFNPLRNNLNFFVTWRSSNPLVTETTPLYTYRLKRVSQPGAHPVPLGDTVRMSKATETNYTGLPVLNLLAVYVFSVSNFALNDRNDFFYRRSLLPPSDTEFVCNASASPLPPTMVQNVSLSNPLFAPENFDNVYRFTLRWVEPEITNGVLEEYQIEVLDPSVGGRQSIIAKRTGLEPDLTSYVMILRINMAANVSNILHAEMRARNSFNVQSKWSDPLVLNLTSFPTARSTISPPFPNITEPSSSIPAYAIALISVGAALSVVLIVVVILVVLCLTSLVKRHRLRSRYEESDMITFSTGRGSISRWPISNFFLVALPQDPWEIMPDDLIIHEDLPLGKGCYGEVYKGILKGRKQRTGSRKGSQQPRLSLTSIVAVKRLHHSSSGVEKSNFLKEIEMMKTVSSGDNELSKFVVNMLGCMTYKEPMVLVLEFMKHGNLLDYLRLLRPKVNGNMKPAPYLEPKGAYSELTPNHADPGVEVLEVRNLLEFARQIAAGMEYLSSLGIIHRDLACRNILVGENKNLKISDFGMSRYIQQDEVYINTSHGLLPLRWMSVESLFHREFTSASDVWSYGVVLWEICTLGGYPYHNYQNKDIIRILRHGYRMRKPQNCSDDIYDVMLHCWHQNPADRPQFSELHKKFDRFLGIHVQDRYPYIDIQNQPYRFDRLAPETGQGTEGEEEEEEGGGGEGECPIDLSESEGEGEEEECQSRFTGATLELSAAPLMSRSKLSMFSSSTVQLEPDEIKSTQSINKIHSIDTDCEAKRSDSVPTSEPASNSDLSYENPIAQNSSFHEDLMNHFERRLSDLGPRSKYPYLQQIDRQQSLTGNSLGSAGSSHSEETLSRMRVQEDRRRGRWWKYSNGSSVGRVGVNGSDKGRAGKRRAVTPTRQGLGVVGASPRHHGYARRHLSGSHVMVAAGHMTEDYGTNL